MNAIYIREHGDIAALKISEIAKPTIRAGEVLVKIQASGINPSDEASVQGKFAGSLLPRVADRDFAGIVVEGPTHLMGLEVWGTGGDLGISRHGTHAEYIAIPASAVSPRPAKLSAEEASVVGVPFVTVFSALVDLGHLKEGEWVIVSGAAGAVGQAALQIAWVREARVIALV